MRSYWKTALAAAFAAGILLFPDRALAAAREAMESWMRDVAPALIPFAAVVPFLTCREAREACERLTGGALRRLFRLRGACAPAVLVGWLAGSPAGALAVSRVAGEEKLTRGEAARLAALSCGVGPVYVLSALGGWRMEACQLLAMIAAALLFRGAWRETESVTPPMSDAREEHPVTAAVLAGLRVCGYMMLFGVGLALLRLTGTARTAAALLLDLPSGAAFARECPVPAPLIAGALGFGGTCILCQNLSVLRQIGVRWRDFLLQKAVTGVLCAGLYWGSEALIPPCAAPALAHTGLEWEKNALLLLLPLAFATVFFRRAAKRKSVS